MFFLITRKTESIRKTAVKSRTTLQNRILFFVLLFFANAVDCTETTMPKVGQIVETADRVARWQMANLRADYQRRYPEDNRLNSWVYGAMYIGMVRWANAHQNEQIFGFLNNLGDELNWALAGKRYNADDHVVGQTWLSLYEKYQDAKMLFPTLQNMNKILSAPSKQEMAYNAHANTERWTWCDALYMAPPLWATLSNITGEARFREFMVKEYKATEAHLFDPAENLFYRDNSFINKRVNNKKVFWSRGNGWVFAGLALLIPQLPEGDDKEYFVDLYKAMAKRIISLQTQAGFWPMSLLDAENYPTPETSGTGFLSFGLMWGINNGLLTDNEYKQSVVRAWQAISQYISEEGFIGYVQPIGAAPGQAWPNRTEVYGAGAFLLLSSEMLKSNANLD